MVWPTDQGKQNETHPFTPHLKGSSPGGARCNKKDGEWLSVERNPSTICGGSPGRTPERETAVDSRVQAALRVVQAGIISPATNTVVIKMPFPLSTIASERTDMRFASKT